MSDGDLVETQPSRALADAAPISVPDRYVLLERLGEGGMGTVWAARDRALDRVVAFKVLHDRFVGAEQERLAAEARAMARLSHRNVVAVYDVGERDRRTYLTMELVRGVHLGRWLETPRAWRDVVVIFRAIAAGLAAAHAAGVVHRDIKPSNILVGDDGEVRIADFGVAHAGSRPTPTPGDDRRASDAVTAGAIGTVVYMSPAQLRGEPADARGDQFAFAAALYEALHGRRPFRGDTIAALREAIAEGCPAPVRDVPRWLHAICARGLAEDPAQRFASMDAVRAVLEGPRRRAPRIVAGAVVLAAGGAAAWAATRAPTAAAARTCDAAQELDGVWDATARARGRAGFAGLGLAYAPAAWERVEHELDRHAAGWIAARDAACRDGVEPARVACLDERRDELRALAARLAAPDRATAAHADVLLESLPAITDCAAPDAAVTARAAPPARIALAFARADVLAGATAAGLDAADRALAAAQASHDRALELEATLARAELRAALGRPADAVGDFGAAADDAVRLGSRAAEIDARVGAARSLVVLGRLDDARAEADRAIAIAQAPTDPRRAARVHAAAAAIAAARGDDAAAVAQLGIALDDAKLARLDESIVVAPLLDARARALFRLGRFDEALADAKLASDRVRLLGEEHPASGRAMTLSAEILLAQGRTDKARAKAAHALRIAEAAGSPDDVAAASSIVARSAAATAPH